MIHADDGSKLFAKMSASRDPQSMFAGEAEGLNAMDATKTIRVPNVVHFGPLGERGSFILMEFLPFGGACNQAELGEQLALMHLVCPPLTLEHARRTSTK
jgi:fructosamine-3-kinase